MVMNNINSQIIVYSHVAQGENDNEDNWNLHEAEPDSELSIKVTRTLS